MWRSRRESAVIDRSLQGRKTWLLQNNEARSKKKKREKKKKGLKKHSFTAEEPTALSELKLKVHIVLNHCFRLSSNSKGSQFTHWSYV